MLYSALRSVGCTQTLANAHVKTLSSAEAEEYSVASS